MVVNRISRRKLEDKVKFFLKRKIPFKKVSTNERVVVHAEGRWGSWMNNDSSFPAAELNFIKQVKKHIVTNNTFKKVRNYFKDEQRIKKIKYFFYNTKRQPGDHFEEVYEIDLKNAYWDTAYNLPKDGSKLFSKEIYEKGLTVSKKSRLAAIGSLARVKRITEFDGTEQKSLPDEHSIETEFLWHTICHKIGKTMAKGSKLVKDDFLFFWVDAMFVKSKAAKDEIEKYFKSQGYQYSVFKCEWVSFQDKHIIVKCTEKGKMITKIKEEIVEREGKKYLRKTKFKEWHDERPFPYKISLSEKDINNLATNE